MRQEKYNIRRNGAYAAFGVALSLLIVAVCYLSSGFSNLSWVYFRQNHLTHTAPVVQSVFGGFPNPAFLFAYVLLVWPAFGLRKGSPTARSVSILSFLLLVVILFLFAKS